jgi:hypothetical protein
LGALTGIFYKLFAVASQDLTSSGSGAGQRA